MKKYDNSIEIGAFEKKVLFGAFIFFISIMTYIFAITFLNKDVSLEFVYKLEVEGKIVELGNLVGPTSKIITDNSTKNVLIISTRFLKDYNIEIGDSISKNQKTYIYYFYKYDTLKSKYEYISKFDYKNF